MPRHYGNPTKPLEATRTPGLQEADGVLLEGSKTFKTIEMIAAWCSDKGHFYCKRSG